MKKLIAFYILSFCFLLVQDGMILVLEKNVNDSKLSTTLSLIDIEDGCDFDSSIDEELKDEICYLKNNHDFSIINTLNKLSYFDLDVHFKDILLETISPPPQLS